MRSERRGSELRATAKRWSRNSNLLHAWGSPSSDLWNGHILLFICSQFLQASLYRVDLVSSRADQIQRIRREGKVCLGRRWVDKQEGGRKSAKITHSETVVQWDHWLQEKLGPARPAALRVHVHNMALSNIWWPNPQGKMKSYFSVGFFKVSMFTKWFRNISIKFTTLFSLSMGVKMVRFSFLEMSLIKTSTFLNVDG